MLKGKFLILKALLLAVIVQILVNWTSDLLNAGNYISVFDAFSVVCLVQLCFVIEKINGGSK